MTEKVRSMCETFDEDSLLSERLIHLVSGYPELYDRSNNNHHNAEVKYEIWRAIGEELDMSYEGAMKKWKALRDAYNRSLREINLIKSGRKIKSKCTPYKFSNQMNFLDHHLKKRGKYFSKKYLEEIEAAQQEEVEEYVDDSIDIKPGDAPKSYVIVHYSPDDGNPEIETKPDIRLHSASKRPRTNKFHPYSNSTKQIKSRSDEDELWLLSLVPVFKRLSGYQRGLAKIKIQQLLLDIEYGDQPQQMLDFTEEINDK